MSSKSKKISKDKATDGDKKQTRMTKRFNKLRLKADDLKRKTVVYIGHLPRGFEEQELKKFFS